MFCTAVTGQTDRKMKSLCCVNIVPFKMRQVAYFASVISYRIVFKDMLSLSTGVYFTGSLLIHWASRLWVSASTGCLHHDVDSLLVLMPAAHWPFSSPLISTQERFSSDKTSMNGIRDTQQSWAEWSRRSAKPFIRSERQRRRAKGGIWLKVVWKNDFAGILGIAKVKRRNRARG